MTQWPDLHYYYLNPNGTEVGMKITINLLLTILLLMPLTAASQPKADTTVKPVVSTGTTNMTKAFQLLVNEGLKLLHQGRNYEAAIIFHKIIADGNPKSVNVQDAQYYIGQALYKLKLYVSAYQYFSQITQIGSGHRHYEETLEWFLKIHRQLPGDMNTLYSMSTFPENLYPNQYKDEIYYYVGQYHYSQGNLDQAIYSLSKVSQRVPLLFVKSEFLKGVSYVRKRQIRGDPQDMLKAAQAFARGLSFLAASQLKGPQVDKITDMTLIALARVFYSIGDYKKALKYYNSISQNSSYWLDSLFELSWTYYQLGQYPRALGNLETLRSPYFSQQYYPEAFVLKAVILFMNCHYADSIAEINRSYKEYWDVFQELRRVLKKYKEPAQFYRYLARISTHGAKYSIKVKRIFNAALADKKVRRNFEYVMRVNREYKTLQALASDPVAKRLVQILLPDIVAFRSLSTEKAGRLARDRMKRVYRDLRHVLTEALKVRFECNNALAGKLSSDLKSAQVKTTKKGFKLDNEHRRWPFDGEYWKDELGSYYYPIRSYCK